MYRFKIGNDIDAIDKRLVYEILTNIKKNISIEKGISKNLILDLTNLKVA